MAVPRVSQLRLRTLLIAACLVAPVAACAEPQASSEEPPQIEAPPTDSDPLPAEARETEPSPASDSLITSNGIGPLSLSMSEQDLLQLLGDGAVERIDSYIGEGFCAPGSRIFPGTPDEIEIIWSDTSYTVISTASVSRPSSPWHTPAGVRVGSNLEELEAISGEPIQFGGFGWDYGGGASWTEDGLRIGLRLAATPESEREVTNDPRYSEILGERSVRSDHPVVRRLTILVERIDLTGPGPSEVQYECGE